MGSLIFGGQPTRWKSITLKSAAQKSRRSNSSGIRKRKAVPPRRLPIATPMPRWKLLHRRILQSGWGDVEKWGGWESLEQQRL